MTGQVSINMQTGQATGAEQCALLDAAGLSINAQSGQSYGIAPELTQACAATSCASDGLGIVMQGVPGQQGPQGVPGDVDGGTFN